MNRLRALGWFALAVTTAGHAASPGDRAHVGGSAVRDAQGRIALNQAAGHGNAQANVAAIAVATDAGLLRLDVGQRVTAGDATRDASARLDGQALSNTRGLLSINQVAGGGNAQANAFGLGRADLASGAPSLGQHVEGLGDAALAAVAGNAPIETAATAVPLREAVIAGDALRGSQGAVQLNQTAGTGNRAANTIVLLLPGSAP
ncbi:hypothetical protein [Cognatilysobacter bugurensis]|uniref:Adhesin n=1 Tax=Cognatilysobacter bugurensis TaxID=543356 RepID=A0A918T3V1_9GAMM|nr:hypothetical protein [Lysobacter bugurensis]GHA87114.1 hypothetical protein GCM10007067_26200 [Lysobacter bugurensis]